MTSTMASPVRLLSDPGPDTAGPIALERRAARMAASTPGSFAGPERRRTFAYDVAVVGLGYVGLPTSLAFHTAGSRVLGVDVSEARLAEIGTGRADLVPSDVLRLQDARLAEIGTYDLTSDLARLSEARTVIICVPTPVDGHFVPDTTLLRSACAAVVAAAVPGQLVMLTSTTYVGTTTDLLVVPLAARGLRAGHEIAVAFSPERIDPGNDRHAHEAVTRVVGGATPSCTVHAARALAGYTRHVHQVSSVGAAELTKLVENTFRAVNIALANEMAEISGVLGLDVVEVIEAAATKPYGFMPFFPGPGVGGHCIPCDPHYLLWQLRSARLSTPVIEQAMNGIAGRPRRVVQRATETLASHGRAVAGSRVLLVGVTYKPDVRDVRQSPALEILDELAALGAHVAYHDPLVVQVRLGSGEVLDHMPDPWVFGADLVVVHTVHTTVDLGWLADVPAVLDTTYRMAGLPRRVVV